LREKPQLGQLIIETRREGDVWTMRLLGELDLSNVEQLEEAFRGVEAAEGVEEIILDLGGLEFVDSTGLKLLLELSARSRADSNRLRMRDAVGQVRRVLEIAGAYERMPFDE
jgi:anti-anti-sigma factor